ncbi:mono/diheme cytochrome c family protein [Mesorhizobium sp. RMAD-H1]|nr:mono/diheme cytochrome c family protein [Mesorhizobium sp. RMAD-H1]
MLTDEQVAAVVNYIRTQFGNNYKDAAAAEDVKDAR